MAARPPEVRAHIAAVNGLRGLAILLVLVFHFWQQTWTPLRLELGIVGLNFNVLAETGFIGVQLFFVLSGFCIALPYAGGRPFLRGEFLRRRAAKILPSFWLFLLIYSLFFRSEYHADFAVWLRHLAANLFFQQLSAPDYLYHSFNVVLWSLAVEVHFYLLFLCLAPLWLARSQQALLLSLVIWAGFGVWALGQDADWFDVYRHRLWANLPYFCVGVALAKWHAGGSVRHAGWLGLLGMVIWIGVAWSLYAVRYDPALIPGTRWPTGREFLLVPVLAVGFGLTLLGAIQSAFWRRVFSQRVLILAGLISYNLYIWHQFIIVQLRQANIPPQRDIPFGQDGEWQLAMWLIALSLSLTVAWVLTWYFEEPLRRRYATPGRWREDVAVAIGRMRAAWRSLRYFLARVPPAPAAPGPAGRIGNWWWLFLPVGAALAYLHLSALQIRPDGVWAGHLNIWSDWPLHLAMAHGFADRSPGQWLAHHPMFAHGSLSYPFVVNLLSGLLLRAGLSLDAAMTLPTLLAGLATPVLLFLLFRLLLRTVGLSLLAVAVFYLGAGLGGWSYLIDTVSAGRWGGLAYPAIEVSRLDRYDWYSGNALVGMLLPQRAFVLGFPLAVLSFYLLLTALLGRGRKPLWRALSGGALAGLMPIIHSHSFIALALLGAAIAVVYLARWRIWLAYALPAGAIGLAISLSFLLGGGDGLPNHLRWAPGFAAPAGFGSWLLMWWQLWGLALPALALGVWLRPPGRLFWLFLLAGTLCFALANLVLIQPNRWDNAKLLLWAYACWSPVWAIALAGLWQRCRAGPVLAVVLAAALMLTGTVELWRLLRVDRGSYMIASESAVELASRIRAETPATAVFATEPSHNHPVMAFAGRPILLGFTGWIANLGFDHRQREQALGRIFAGGEDARRLLIEHAVDYVYIGPGERRRFAVNERWFRAHYPVAFAGAGARVYRVTPERSSRSEIAPLPIPSKARHSIARPG